MACGGQCVPERAGRVNRKHRLAGRDARRHGRRDDQRDEVHVLPDVAVTVYQREPLRARVEPDSEVRVEGGDDLREPLLGLRHLACEQGVVGALGVGVEGDDLAAELGEQPRQHHHGGGVRVVDHEAEAPGADLLHRERAQVRLGVEVRQSRVLEDHADLLVGRAAELLAHEHALDGLRE